MPGKHCLRMRLLATEFCGDRVHMCAYIHVPWCDVINLPHWIRLWCASCHAAQYSMPSGRWVPWDRAQERTGCFQRVCLLRKHTRTSAQLVSQQFGSYHCHMGADNSALKTRNSKPRLLTAARFSNPNFHQLFVAFHFLRWWFICPSTCMADFQISSHFAKRGTGSYQSSLLLCAYCTETLGRGLYLPSWCFLCMIMSNLTGWGWILRILKSLSDPIFNTSDIKHPHSVAD